ncbi:MAG TPA: YrdB family protein [Streptosporangiaceae bacterium]|nr:YrdB family protein [Streptosporangiaceae bacterium]
MADENDVNKPDLPLTGDPVKATVLTLRFLSELALLVAIAVAGANAGGPTAIRIVAAIGGAIVAAVIWGLVIARQAKRRLDDPARLTAEIVLFGIATAALALERAPIAAAIFGVVTIGLAILARFVAPEG